MAGGNSTSSPEGRAHTNFDDAFQNLLLRIAAKASERSDSNSLIQLFCRITREFFQCTGVYFWRRHAGDELVGEQADGKLAGPFIGLRLLPQQSAVTAEAGRATHCSRRAPDPSTCGLRSLSAERRLLPWRGGGD